MEVIIHGQTTQNFCVTISDNHGTEDFVVSKLLIVDENDLEREVRECAAQEHFWHQLAIDAEHAREEFEKITFAQYTAHIEKYAKYYLKGSGEKTPTGTAKENAAILIFSRDANQEEAAEVAFKGYKAETTLVGISGKSFSEFKEAMFVYEPSFEDAQTHLLALKHKADQLGAISSAFNTKSWSVKTLAADRRAELKSNI